MHIYCGRLNWVSSIHSSFNKATNYIVKKITDVNSGDNLILEECENHFYVARHTSYISKSLKTRNKYPRSMHTQPLQYRQRLQNLDTFSNDFGSISCPFPSMNVKVFSSTQCKLTSVFRYVCNTDDIFKILSFILSLILIRFEKTSDDNELILF